MKKRTYIFCLRDLNKDKQCGIWSLQTTYEPGDIALKFKAAFARLSLRWAVHFWESEGLKEDKEPSNTTVVSIIKAIIDIIKIKDDDEPIKSTTILLPPNYPWSKTDEHRRKLEQ